MTVALPHVRIAILYTERFYFCIRIAYHIIIVSSSAAQNCMVTAQNSQPYCPKRIIRKEMNLEKILYLIKIVTISKYINGVVYSLQELGVKLSFMLYCSFLCRTLKIPLYDTRRETISSVN